MIGRHLIKHREIMPPPPKGGGGIITEITVCTDSEAETIRSAFLRCNLTLQAQLPASRAAAAGQGRAAAAAGSKLSQLVAIPNALISGQFCEDILEQMSRTF